MFFNSRKDFETPKDAKKTREKARQDHSLEKPGAKEKLLAKLPGISRTGIFITIFWSSTPVSFALFYPMTRTVAFGCFRKMC